MRLIVIFFIYISYSFSNGLFEPLPKDIKYDKEIVKLGRELFYDPILSKDNDVSCFSCHFNYGADDKQFSKGTNNKLGNMNSPSVFNLPFKIGYFWNGRKESIESQVQEPIFEKTEMAASKEVIISRLNNSDKYIKLFKNAYNQAPNFKNMIDAIYQFEETLISVDSKFDRYLRGEEKLSKKEKEGLDLFISYGCVSCHNGINIGGNSYQKFGSVIKREETNEKWNDRYDVTKKQSDKMVFVVPSLRNVEKTAPYFHDGSALSLKDAIILMGYHNIGVKLKDTEIDAIEAFLKTLTGEIPKTFLKD